MTGERRGKRIDDLPDWAKRLAKEYGATNLDDRQDIFFGSLIDRRSGLRKDDLIELLIDDRALRGDVDPWVRGMLLSVKQSAVEMLDENRQFRSIARDVIVEVRLVTQRRHAASLQRSRTSRTPSRWRL